MSVELHSGHCIGLTLISYSHYATPKFEDYVSTSLRSANLSSDEQQHFSFLITETEKQLLGYKPRPEAQYLCHLTNNRLILEPQTNISGIQFTSKLTSKFSVSDDTSFYQIPYEEISSFKVIRSLNLVACVKVALKSALNVPEDELVFVASPPPQNKMAKQLVNCSTDLGCKRNSFALINSIY